MTAILEYDPETDKFDLSTGSETRRLDPYDMRTLMETGQYAVALRMELTRQATLRGESDAETDRHDECGTVLLRVQTLPTRNKEEGQAVRGDPREELLREDRRGGKTRHGNGLRPVPQETVFDRKER